MSPLIKKKITSIKKCKFFPSCSDESCHFFHPKEKVLTEIYLIFSANTFPIAEMVINAALSIEKIKIYIYNCLNETNCIFKF